MVVVDSAITGPLRAAIQLPLALWGQPKCWYGPQWKWVWHPCSSVWYFNS